MTCTPRLINKVTHVVPLKSTFVIRSQQLTEELTSTVYLSRSLFPCNQRHRQIYTNWQHQYPLLHSYKEFCCIRRYLRRKLLPFETMRKQHTSLNVIIIYINKTNKYQYVMLKMDIRRKVGIPCIKAISNKYVCLTPFCKRRLSRLDLLVSIFASCWFALYTSWIPSWDSRFINITSFYNRGNQWLLV